MQITPDTPLADLGLHPITRNELAGYWYAETTRYRSDKKLSTDLKKPLTRLRNELAARVTPRMVLEQWYRSPAYRNGWPKYCHPPYILKLLTLLDANGITASRPC